MMNYCEYYAENAQGLFRGFNVFSNVDPSREWNGKPTIEFNEPEEPRTTTTLSGSSIVERSIYAIARTRSCKDSETVLLSLRAYCEQESTRLSSTGKIYAWAIDETGTATDSRGIVEGESFYGYVKINIAERN